jgi:hypothetical protein
MSIGARLVARGALLALAIAASGCGGGNAASHLKAAPEFAPKGQSKCGVKKSAARPLIVEWPAADRAALEAQTQSGVVVVRYDGCEMEVLRQCRARGGYFYAPVTRKEDHLAIRDTDELYAAIPAHAAAFEAKLATSGELDVEMTIVGNYSSQQRLVRRDQLEGDCGKATHVVLDIATGAFEFSAATSAEVKGGGRAFGVEAGAGSTAKKELLNRDGYRSACERATKSDKAPPDGCGAFLRVEVAELSAPLAPAPSPVAAPYFFTPPAGYAPPPPPPRRGPRSAQEIVGVVAASVGGAGLGVGAVAGLVALVQKSDLSSACQDTHCGPSQADLVSAYHTSTTLSTIGFVAGGVLLAGGIVLLSTAPERPLLKSEPATARAWIAPVVGVGVLGAKGAF